MAHCGCRLVARRGRTLLVVFADTGLGEELGTMGAVPQLWQRQSKGSDSPFCQMGAAIHSPSLEAERDKNATEQSLGLKGQVHPQCLGIVPSTQANQILGV